MTTLLIRLAGPMQSWGTQSRFLDRDTGLEPSKSGVVGLLCAALGKARDEAPTDRPRLSELAALRMGVRVDQEGAVQMDYQTAEEVAKADGSGPTTVVSRRYYLADADFLVGLEGDDALLRQIDQALLTPHWPLCLGRKSFPPSAPVRLADAGPGSRWWDEPLEGALAAYPLRPHPGSAGSSALRIVIDDTGQGPDVRHDVPIDFATREFGLRHVRTGFVARPE